MKWIYVYAKSEYILMYTQVNKGNAQKQSVLLIMSLEYKFLQKSTNNFCQKNIWDGDFLDL